MNIDDKTNIYVLAPNDRLASHFISKMVCEYDFLDPNKHKRPIIANRTDQFFGLNKKSNIIIIALEGWYKLKDGFAIREELLMRDIKIYYIDSRYSKEAFLEKINEQ